jgi:hypothetical protein
MKLISGYVLVQDSSAGVPNLVVSAHDARETAASPPAERNIFGLVQQLGRRLGSVLTDSNGRFVLTGEDLQFQGNEARPNLLLTVSAPEDVQKADRPIPLPPEERLLYISTVARREAGAEEAFVIRLLPAQIDKFSITTASNSAQGTAPASGIADTLQAGWDASDLLKTRFQARLQAQITAVHTQRDAAKAKLKNLSGIPAHLRGANNPLQNNKLLIPDRQSLTQLPDLQKQALTQGLTRLKTRTPIVQLYLTPQEIRDAGLELDRGSGKITGSAKTQKVMAKILDGMKGYDLVRTRGSGAISVEDLQRRYLRPPSPAKRAANAAVSAAATPSFAPTTAAVAARPGSSAARTGAAPENTVSRKKTASRKQTSSRKSKKTG